jgi:hypothetical protein
VAVPNGSTPFSVGAAYEFVATPSQGTITVIAGTFAPVDIQFSYRPTSIAGSVTPSDAELTIDGFVQTVSGGSFNDSVLPGSHSLVASAPGYVSKTVTAQATAGNVTIEHISLEKSASSSNGSGGAASSSSGGLYGLSTWVGLGVVVVVAIAAVAIVLLRQRSRSG